MTERRNQLKAANPGPEVSSCALQLGDRIFATCMLVLRDNTVGRYCEMQVRRR